MNKVAFIFAILCLTSITLVAQQKVCYCYENMTAHLAEWLYFKNDSVMILGLRNKTCKEKPDLDKWFSNLRSKTHSLFPVETKEGQYVFTKTLKTKYAGNEVTLIYHYRCTVTPKGLQVHLEYENLESDGFGPPDRLYLPYKIPKQTSR